jgi:hypothetical protein
MDTTTEFWMQPEDSQIGKWQKQLFDISGTNTFCVLPWIHLATRPNGDMRLCCGSNASGAATGDYTVGLVKNEDGQPANFGRDLPSEAFNSEYMKSVRKIMLAGQIPASCKKCMDEESRGIASKRVWETITWDESEDIDIKELVESTQEDGSIPFKLQYLDLRLGNTCNIKCIMCSPHDSSQWVADYKKVYPLFKSDALRTQMNWDKSTHNNFWHENKDFWAEVYEQIPNIKQLYFAGGEPLMIREHKWFLQEIIKQGYAGKILLRYNTNGILIDEEIIEIWTHFRKVKVGFSLDGIGDRLHYIRYPTDWEVVQKNLQRLEDTPDNIQTTIACAAQILNIKHIPDFIKWKVQSGLKKLNTDTNAAGQLIGGGLIGVHLIYIPTYLSLRVLPKEDKAEVRRLFAELKQWLWDNYTQDDEFWVHNHYGWKRWEGMLDWMDSEDHTHLLPDFKEFITSMSDLRKLDFKAIFPELSHLI